MKAGRKKRNHRSKTSNRVGVSHGASGEIKKGTTKQIEKIVSERNQVRNGRRGKNHQRRG